MYQFHGTRATALKISNFTAVIVLYEVSKG